MNVIPYEASHIGLIEAQPQQLHMVSQASFEYLSNLKSLGPAYTGVLDGKVIGCAGIIQSTFGSGTLWALLHRDAARHMLGIHRCAKRLLDLHQMRRLEATTEVGFLAGCKWLEMLGFKPEGIMPSYGPDGASHWRYGRVHAA